MQLVSVEFTWSQDRSGCSRANWLPARPVEGLLISHAAVSNSATQASDGLNSLVVHDSLIRLDPDLDYLDSFGRILQAKAGARFGQAPWLELAWLLLCLMF